MPVEFHKFLTDDTEVVNIMYPVDRYPEKINSKSFKKESVISGELVGIKGQYLIFDQNRVFNVRAHAGYIIDFII